MRIGLIDTSPADQPGSMRRCADLLLAAGRGDGWEFERFELAPAASEQARLPSRLRNLAHHTRICFAAKRAARRRDIDLFHVVDGSHGYVVQLLPPGRSVVTVHDLIPWLQAHGTFAVGAPGRSAQWLISRSLKGVAAAAAVAADSQSTARDLQSAGVSAGKIRVVHLALAPELIPGPDDASGEPWSTRRARSRPVLLHVGNNGFYKNREGAVRIFAEVRRQAPCSLCLAGPPPSSAVQRLIDESGLAGDVDVVINPTDARLKQLYASAAVLLFPSIYEGFGWPPLEAMAWGCPVVASNGGSLGEIVGDAGLVRPVGDESGMAADCVRLLGDPAAAEKLIATGRAWAARFSVERLRRELRAFYLDARQTAK